LRHLAAALAVVALASVTASASTTLSFVDGNITNTTNATGADYTVKIYGSSTYDPDTPPTIGNFTPSIGNNQALFVFSVAAGGAGDIHEIYFDDGTLLGISGLIDVDQNTGGMDANDFGESGVDYTAGTADPGDLPGGNTIIPPFEVTAGFVADSDPNGQSPAVGDPRVSAGESLGILFNLKSGQTYLNVLSSLALGGADGGLRIGIHVGDLANGKSDSFINGPPLNPQAVPEPASFATVGLGSLLGLGYAWRKRKRAAA